MREVSGSRTLHRLIYYSRQSVQGEAADAEVDQIIRGSIAANRAAGLTGLLLVHDGWFLQALEGPAEQVMLTYNRILSDGRHDDVTILSAGPAELREFGDWNMCARRMCDSDDAIIATLAKRDNLDPSRLNGRTALRLLKAVRGIQARTQVHAIMAVPLPNAATG